MLPSLAIGSWTALSQQSSSVLALADWMAPLVYIMQYVACSPDHLHTICSH